MASYTPGDSVSDAKRTPNERSRETSKADSSPKPASASIGKSKTEVPSLPEQIHHAFERPLPDPVAIGSPALELSLRLEGKLGRFLDRDRTNPNPTYVPIDPPAYRSGAYYTIASVLERCMRMKGFIENMDIEIRSQEVAQTLANGIVVMTYLKLRAINSLDYHQMSKFLKKPKVPTPFEVPAPFALAISQLGVFKVSSLETELTLVPTLPDNTGGLYGLPSTQKWSTTKYAQAMEYAKSLGLQFSTVDLSVKLGSSWWLYDQELEEDIFTLTCPLPEDNYTEATAALHTLFCANAGGTTFNVFFDLTGIPTGYYGSMLRNPHCDINVSTYLAIDEAPETVWKVV